MTNKNKKINQIQIQDRCRCYELHLMQYIRCQKCLEKLVLEEKQSNDKQK